MYKNRFRGFTLIELLVVIAIIGVLSAVVLASLNTARNKGNDAAIQSDMATIQTQAEIYYGGAGVNTYGNQGWVSGAATACNAVAPNMFLDSTIVKALAGADAVNGAGNVACFANLTGYFVAAALTSGTSYWCVDHTGTGKMVNAALPTAIPAGNVCP
ncbi:type II secretion system protein [Candidatus Kaiserbacteria bacterium]|nr:type II secretion system protein [Candidatus Kaiserbacteria bacterium]